MLSATTGALLPRRSRRPSAAPRPRKVREYPAAAGDGDGDGGRPRARAPLVGLLEDAASSVMVDEFGGAIGEFGRQLRAALADRAEVYAHGSYALYARLRAGGPLRARAEAAMARSATVRHLLEPYTRPPRDVDFSVVPYRPMACRSFAECSRADPVHVVAESLRLLRQYLHDAIVARYGGEGGDEGGRGFLYLLEEAVAADMRADPRRFGGHELESIELLDSYHTHVEHSEDGSRVRVVDRGRASGQACAPGANMRRLKKGEPGCFPLRDSLNTTISFPAAFGDGATVRSDFVLARLALVVRARFRGVERPVVAKANFVDVAVLRGGDQAYRAGTAVGGRPAVPAVVGNGSGAGLAPYPASLAYAFEACAKQLAWYEQQLPRMDPSDPAREGAAAKAQRLRDRLVAIALLAALEQGGASGAGAGAATKGRLFDEARARCKALASAVGWWSANVARAAGLYAAAEVDRYASLASVRRPSSQAHAAAAAAAAAATATARPPPKALEATRPPLPAPAFEAPRTAVAVAAGGGPGGRGARR